MGNFSPRRSSTTDMLSRSTRLVSSPIRTAAVVRPGSGLVAADVKQLVEDEDTGAQSYRYVRTGTDHYSLAFTYECIAASRYGPSDYRMQCSTGYDEDAHWRDNILNMDF